MPLRYSIVSHWSGADEAFLVSLPEWSHLYGSPVTHGDSYTRALANALEVLALYVDIATVRGEPLPVPGGLRLVPAIAS